nr:MAG TPA: hypothetical protein [Caudoviricetes sp.]
MRRPPTVSAPVKLLCGQSMRTDWAACKTTVWMPNALRLPWAWL